jgi:excisionase family DNA binding protein
MKKFEQSKKPSKDEQHEAMAAYNALTSQIEQLSNPFPNVEISETGEKIKIPLKALKLLAYILKVTGQGKPVSIVPVATEMTTQAAAEMLGCSRPHVVKLLEEGVIPYTKVGKHRRVKYEAVMKFRQKMKADRKKRLIDMMKKDEDSGLYDS